MNLSLGFSVSGVKPCFSSQSETRKTDTLGYFQLPSESTVVAGSRNEKLKAWQCVRFRALLQAKKIFTSEWRGETLDQNSTSDLWFPTSGLLLFSRLGSHEISHLVTQGLHLGL